MIIVVLLLPRDMKLRALPPHAMSDSVSKGMQLGKLGKLDQREIPDTNREHANLQDPHLKIHHLRPGTFVCRWTPF